MELLKQRIISDGLAIGTEIVKVDSFLNHCIDIELIDKMGEEFKRLFSESDINKILTIESSGIAIACITSMHFGNVPVVFAKKSKPNTLNDGFFSAEVRSFTKGTVSEAIVSKKYLCKGDRVLIIDDFLAHGEAALGLISLAEQAGAEVVGIGIAIEKAFQGGAERVREKGIKVESLAVITSVKDGNIYFK